MSTVKEIPKDRLTNVYKSGNVGSFLSIILLDGYAYTYIMIAYNSNNETK